MLQAGTTGALMSISRFVLKTLPAFDRRPAPPWADTQRPTHVLALGANVDCPAEIFCILNHGLRACGLRGW